MLLLTGLAKSQGSSPLINGSSAASFQKCSSSTTEDVGVRVRPSDPSVRPSPGPEPPGPGQRHSIHLSINTLVGVLKPPSHLALSVARLNQSSAKLILTLKNRELIHFGFLLRGFVAKEFIHDT